MIKISKLETISSMLKLKINNDIKNINSIKTFIGDALTKLIMSET
jgi:hypothetical protein